MATYPGFRPAKPLSFIFMFVLFWLALIAGGLIWKGHFSVQLAALAAAFISLGLFIWYRGAHRRIGMVRSRHDNLLLAGVIILLALWAFSPNLRQGAGRVGWLLAYPILFYFFLDAFDRYLDHSAAVQALLWGTGLVLGMAVLETYASYLHWWQLTGVMFSSPPFPYRIASLVGHSNSFMGLVNLFAPLALVSFLKEKNLWGRVCAGLWIVLYLVAVPFSSSRGGWIGLFAWLVTFFGLQLLAKNSIHRLIAWLAKFKKVLAAAAVPVVLVLGFAAFRFWTAFAAHPSHGGNPFAGRGDIWLTALQAWLQSPVLGVGPGRFGYAYLQAAGDIPPAFWALHAHGLPVEVLTEFGLVGLALLLVGLAFAFRSIWTRFPVVNDQWKLWAYAGAAGIIGWLAQMLVDDQTGVPAVMIPLVVLTAWLFTLPGQPLRRSKSISMAWLAVPGFVILAGAAWSLWAYAPLAQGISQPGSITRKDLALTAETSAQRDPALPFYQTQAALAWASAWAESGAPDELEKARQYLLASLRLEAAPSWLWADLAVLDWHAGEPEQALEHIRAAIQRAPNEPVYPLNLGWFYEAAGQVDQAKAAYQNALEIRPAWSSAPFWKSTQARQEALSGWQQVNQQTIPYDLSYTAQALTALEAGDTGRAAYSLAAAEWAGEPSTYRHMAQSTVHLAAQNPFAALAEYEKVTTALSQPPAQSVDLANTYNLWLYGRQGLEFQWVPGLLSISEAHGEEGALYYLWHEYVNAGNCLSANYTWHVLSHYQTGGSLEPVPEPPVCNLSDSEVKQDGE